MTDDRELLCFKVFHDLQCDDIGIGEVVGGFEGFVLEPENNSAERALSNRNRLLKKSKIPGNVILSAAKNLAFPNT